MIDDCLADVLAFLLDNIDCIVGGLLLAAMLIAGEAMAAGAEYVGYALLGLTIATGMAGPEAAAQEDHKHSRWCGWPCHLHAYRAS